MAPHHHTQLRLEQLPPGRVVQAHGRAGTRVYHASTTCPKIRTKYREVNLGFAQAAHCRPCQQCWRNQA